ncbi:DUF305 domain-containing protein [Bradyrhizobium sp. URHD0069]|uniref:DUF305 domain-containing protein n=1 Tax=Bradyrhizobium sp. URHD0069 TaxID=1380355 RepID=UPI000AD93796|nr:DUF305 domain-containing protein [Bradyrhizobium sp. URHD0069]
MAILLGLISSSYSTLISQLTAARLGRDAAVDWMSVAAIPARDWALQAEPSWSAVAIGVAFHQWADFSWALVFFGLLGRWTSRLAPGSIALLALPWAMLTSALEWLFLVPVFPFAQPVFTLQQPYWIGLLVHLSSAIVYPLFYWLRWPSEGAGSDKRNTFLKSWFGGLLIALAAIGIAAFVSPRGFEIPWLGRDKLADQTYMRHMRTHHQQGIELASIAAQRAMDPHLRALARLMAASQAGENRIFESWWQSWFKEPMALCSAAERAEMPGLLTAEQVRGLRQAQPASFDELFVQLMTFHHAGAVAMADKELQGNGDLRLRVMAHAIRHEQQGEIALMEGTSGLPAVRQAIQNMLADNVNSKR